MEGMGRLYLAGWQIELVTFLQRPAELLGEGCRDRRLSAPRDPYDNQDCARVKRSHERKPWRVPFLVDHRE
jgi:hypothetical protein